MFGVPLSVSVQRCGDALPQCIQQALSWLRMNALDQVGLFRKSGVRSRIQKLKEQAESNCMDLDGQQAYDVADMLKQYFRELPDSLLTNKLSETFIAIFQCKYYSPLAKKKKKESALKKCYIIFTLSQGLIFSLLFLRKNR